MSIPNQIIRLSLFQIKQKALSVLALHLLKLTVIEKNACAIEFGTGDCVIMISIFAVSVGIITIIAS
jgi:hypothetical protein